MSNCEFCNKELSEEKLEHLHGCLDCAGYIYLIGKEYVCIHCAQNKLDRLQKANQILALAESLEFISKQPRYLGYDSSQDEADAVGSENV